MANVIKIKSSGNPGNVPASLEHGEIAINYADGKIYYKNSFCEVVCETRFAQPTGNFSEKTIRPMHFHRPFVLVAPPHTLKYLKEFHIL